MHAGGDTAATIAGHMDMLATARTFLVWDTSSASGVDLQLSAALSGQTLATITKAGSGTRTPGPTTDPPVPLPEAEPSAEPSLDSGPGSLVLHARNRLAPP